MAMSLSRDFQRPGRSTAIAENGMAATSHSAATLVALDILRRGGNAADAAVAAVATQCVVEPGQTGLGGDCFALFANPDGKIGALNSSGRAPAAVDVEALRDHFEEGFILSASPHAVTVPGAVAGWQALLEAAGTWSLADVLQPAIAFARNGFHVTPRIARDWTLSEERLRASEGAKRYYLPNGAAPAAGDRVVLSALAGTLKAIADEGSTAFYEGPIAAKMADFLRASGGYHQFEDFATFRPEFVEPIATEYQGIRILECPPNGQGVIALLMLNILKSLGPVRAAPDSAERYHLLIEATKLAFRERDRWLADPEIGGKAMSALLELGVAADLASMIDPANALGALPLSPIPAHQDTVYLTVVDKDRNVVSLINSLFEGFGSGLCCPDTGVLFHCRGRAFNLEAGHPNVMAPRKRPAHTIIPGMMLKDGRPFGGFGVMGGDFQPVGHTQVVSNLLDYGMGPQQAIDWPRIMAYPGPPAVEGGVSAATRESLAALGHRLVDAEQPLGGGQMILIDHERGILLGGSDFRKDGIALGY